MSNFLPKSLTYLPLPRNMKPEVRKAQREQTIRALKEKNRAAAAKKAAAAGGDKKKMEKKTNQKQQINKPAPKQKGAKTGGQGGRR